MNNFKEYVDETRQLYYELKHDLERREILMAKATRTSASMDGAKVQTSLTDKLTEIMALLAELDDVINTEKQELEKRQSNIMEVINQTDLEKREKEVLVLRAVQCWPWDEISENLFWSVRQLQRWYRNGIRKIVA